MGQRLTNKERIGLIDWLCDYMSGESFFTIAEVRKAVKKHRPHRE